MFHCLVIKVPVLRQLVYFITSFRTCQLLFLLFFKFFRFSQIFQMSCRFRQLAYYITVIKRCQHFFNFFYQNKNTVRISPVLTENIRTVYSKADTRNPLSLLSRERRLLRSLSDGAFESPSDTSIPHSLHLILCAFKVGDCSFYVQKVGQPFQTLFSKILYLCAFPDFFVFSKIDTVG